MYNDSLSPADIAVLSGNGSNGNNGNSGWGENGSWWIIVFLIFAFLGWGRGGFGNDGGNGGGNSWGFSPCCTPATQQGLSDAMNFNQLDNGIRGIQNGLCDGFYAVNTSIMNLGQSLLTCCCDVKTGIMQNGYETRDAINMNSNAINSNLCNGFNSVTQGINTLGFNLQDCCCQTQRAIDGVNFNNAKNTADIIQAQNANTQRIIDMMTQNEIQSLRDTLQSANLTLAQERQTATLVSQLKPCPQPAYLTCSPYASYNFNPSMFTNSNCGCC